MGNFSKLSLAGCGTALPNIEPKKKPVSNVHLYVFKSFDHYFFYDKENSYL